MTSDLCFELVLQKVTLGKSESARMVTQWSQSIMEGQLATRRLEGRLRALQVWLMEWTPQGYKQGLYNLPKGKIEWVAKNSKSDHCSQWSVSSENRNNQATKKNNMERQKSKSMEVECSKNGQGRQIANHMRILQSIALWNLNVTKKRVEKKKEETVEPPVVNGSFIRVGSAIILWGEGG